MNRRFNLHVMASAAVCVVFVAGLTAAALLKVDKSKEPVVITPPTASTQDQAGRPPSDAVVLFDGKDLSKWTGNGGEAKWKIQDGYMEVTRTGSIQTVEKFGDCQLHVEWATPSEVKGEGQGRGNSGVYLQGKYEVQVLDSYNNKTYFDGQAGSVYGVAPPLVNASRKPGEWQTYDIIFRAPRDGKPGSLTVLHNGVLIQDRTPVGKATRAAEVKGEGPVGPILLQDHGNPVRYRNIWIRPLDKWRFAD